jgi:hypothetical protein
VDAEALCTEETVGVTLLPAVVPLIRVNMTPQANNEGDEEQELADETNTSIPGGRTDPSHTPTKYRYDTRTQIGSITLVYLNERSIHRRSAFFDVKDFLWTYYDREH